MANEITLTMKLLLDNLNLHYKFDPGAVQISQATGLVYGPVVIVGTSEEDLLIGDIATCGLLCLLNLDDTNYVTWGPKNSGSMVAMGRLLPGVPAIFQMDPSPPTLRWVAHTNPCNVQALLLNT